MYFYLDHVQANPLGKSCLSPLTLLKIYDPKALNGSSINQSPIYHSSVDSSENIGADQSQNDSNKRADFADAESNLDDLANIRITPATLMNMCPALLVQIEQRSCKDDQIKHSDGHSDKHDDGDDDDHHHHDTQHRTDSTTKKEISTYCE